jgi:hypothetical protein
MSEAAGYILKGILAAVIYFLTSIMLPLFIFQSLVGLSYGGMDFGLTQAQYEQISFWITALGLVGLATTFVSASSPKNSTRKAIMAIILIFVNVIYIYIYRYSGATNIVLNLDSMGFPAIITLDLANMVYMAMGLVALNLIVAIYDLIISIVAPLGRED